MKRLKSDFGDVIGRANEAHLTEEKRSRLKALDKYYYYAFMRFRKRFQIDVKLGFQMTCRRCGLQHRNTYGHQCPGRSVAEWCFRCSNCHRRPE